MKPITIWSKNENGKWLHNHIENGHVHESRPTPKCENHKKVWASGNWRREHAFLNENNVVVHLSPRISYETTV